MFKPTLAGLAALSLTACATIMKGDLEPFPIQSEPAGAQVTLRGGDQEIFKCSTPCDLDVPNQTNYQAEMIKSGYRTEKFEVSGFSWDPWIWGNIIWVVGAPIGLIVDFYTGKAYDLAPSQVSKTLVQKNDQKTQKTKSSSQIQ